MGCVAAACHERHGKHAEVLGQKFYLTLLAGLPNRHSSCPNRLLAGGTALPTNVEHDRLMGLLAAGLLSGATTAWALKVGMH